MGGWRLVRVSLFEERIKGIGWDGLIECFRCLPSLKTVALYTGAVSRKLPALSKVKASAPSFLMVALTIVRSTDDKVTEMAESRFSRLTAAELTRGKAARAPKARELQKCIPSQVKYDVTVEK